MNSIFPKLFKTFLLSIIFLFSSFCVKAVDSELSNNSHMSNPIKVEIIQTDDLTKKLNIEVSDYRIIKSKLNHKFIENVEPWSALNNNVVCNLVFEFNIYQNNIGKIEKPFCETSAALLKLNHKSIIDIKNHELYYYQNKEWKNCYELSKIDYTEGKVKVRVQIPILNSELQKLYRLNTVSIDKVRILFNNNDKYIDWVIDEKSRVELYNKLKRLANIDTKELKSNSLKEKKRRGF